MDQKLNIIHGDALQELRSIPDKSVQLVIADPPYNLEKDYGVTHDNLSFDAYLSFSKEWLSQCKRVLKDDGAIYVFMGVRFIAYIYSILERDLGLHFNSWITWHYTQGIGKTRGFSPRHDDILFFTKDKKKFIFNLDPIRIPQKFYRSVNNMRGANPGNVWTFSHVHFCNENRQNHPTQKPEGIYERIVLTSSNQNDMVLDPFLGSGTCLRVCQQLHRQSTGIEINAQYVEMARKRLTMPFYGFDSIDDRMRRVPNDLNDPSLRDEYVKKHIEWFFSCHQNLIDEFQKSVFMRYGQKRQDETRSLF